MTTGERVVMEPTVELALQALLGEKTQEELDQLIEEDELLEEEIAMEEEVIIEEELPVPDEPLSRDLNDLIIQAQEAYELGQEALREGDWNLYGEKQEELQQILEQMGAIIEEEGLDEQF